MNNGLPGTRPTLMQKVIARTEVQFAAFIHEYAEQILIVIYQDATFEVDARQLEARQVH